MMPDAPHAPGVPAWRTSGRHACLQDGRDVAVKVFKGETSPDGQASDEIAVTCHVDHPNLSKYACCSMQGGPD